RNGCASWMKHIHVGPLADRHPPRPRCPLRIRGVLRTFFLQLARIRLGARESRRSLLPPHKENVMTIKRVTIAQHERALVWRNKQFAGVLEPGKRWIVAPFARIRSEEH